MLTNRIYRKGTAGETPSAMLSPLNCSLCFHNKEDNPYHHVPPSFSPAALIPFILTPGSTRLHFPPRPFLRTTPQHVIRLRTRLVRSPRDHKTRLVPRRLSHERLKHTILLWRSTLQWLGRKRAVYVAAQDL